MDLLIPFVSIIGVIIGFLLSTLKEWIQNKPKIKMDMKMGEFNYFRMEEDKYLQTIIKPTNPLLGDYYKVSLQLDVYNTGKGNAAIKDIGVENLVNKKMVVYSNVKIKVNSANTSQNISSFNLPASSIVTLELEWKVKKDEYTESLFKDEIISLERGRLQFKIIARSIINKKHKLLVEPLSILTAYE
ncbi:hypothetical protein [Solibacillus sp. FSL W8-0372]|uniref:hypothetical protein n=1 Tax=Solibacillus sp. FSL W8-0372 TaxID=2921713 RepID=UPI0030CF9ED8